MLGTRIEELLAGDLDASNIVNGSFAPITDDSRQRQLLQEDEEEDFMDEGNHIDSLFSMGTLEQPQV